MARVRYATNRGYRHEPCSMLCRYSILFMFTKLIFIVKRDYPKEIILMNSSYLMNVSKRQKILFLTFLIYFF